MPADFYSDRPVGVGDHQSHEDRDSVLRTRGHPPRLDSSLDLQAYPAPCYFAANHEQLVGEVRQVAARVLLGTGGEPRIRRLGALYPSLLPSRGRSVDSAEQSPTTGHPAVEPHLTEKSIATPSPVFTPA